MIQAQTQPMPGAKGELHAIAHEAARLAAMLWGVDTGSLEVRDTLEALLKVLAGAHFYGDHLFMDNGELCNLAQEAAHLVAALVDPGGDVDATALAQDVQDAIQGLLGHLRVVGLMDCYVQAGGQFGIWGEPQEAYAC